MTLVLKIFKNIKRNGVAGTIFSALRHGSCQRLFLFAASSSAAIFIDAISTALTSPRSNGGECVESAGFAGFQPTH